MPRSVQLTQEVGAAQQFTNAVATAPNLAELLELVPAPYRPRMSDLVNSVYRAAVKSNHVRSYLVTLQKHEQDGDFPPEIGARIAPPAIQISKEYKATSEYKSSKAELDLAALEQKKTALAAAIEVKKKELAHLQSLFAEDQYSAEANKVITTVAEQLVSDAGLTVRNPDGSSASATWPAWIKSDYDRMVKSKLGFPARAISLAYMQVSQETSRKMRGLSLKKDTDKDVDMDDDESRAETVDAMVERKLTEFKKELKLQNVGKKGKGKKANSSPSPQKLSYKVRKQGGSGGSPPKRGGAPKRGNSRGGRGKGKK